MLFHVAPVVIWSVDTGAAQGEVAGHRQPGVAADVGLADRMVSGVTAYGRRGCGAAAHACASRSLQRARRPGADSVSKVLTAPARAYR